MLTGFIVVLLGLLMFVHPELLSYLVASLFVLFGLGMMAAGWQFRRLRKPSQSPFINWIIRW